MSFRAEQRAVEESILIDPSTSLGVTVVAANLPLSGNRFCLAIDQRRARRGFPDSAEGLGCADPASLTLCRIGGIETLLCLCMTVLI